MMKQRNSIGGLYLKTDSAMTADIAERAQQYVDKKDAAAVYIFAQYFFEFSLAEKLKTYTLEELGAMAADAYQFFKERTKNVPKVRVYNPSKKEQGWERQYTVIELLNDDMPFLVDSLSEEIARQGLKIIYMTHPVLTVKRDAKGRLKTMEARQVPLPANKTAESLIHFQVSYVGTEKKRARLKKILQDVLKAVRCSVDAWPELTERTKGIAQYVTSLKTMLPKKTPPKAAQAFLADVEEIEQFFTWLKDNNFVFLGYIEHHVVKGKMVPVPETALGQCTLENMWLPSFTEAKIPPEQILKTVHITKSSEKSKVHRSAHMDIISLQKLDKKGQVTGICYIAGMFTSIVYYQSARRIPLLHRKIALIQQRSGFSLSGHSGKALAAILEDFPRDELFQASVDELFEMAMGVVTLTTTPRVRLFLRKDESERFVSCLVFLPRDRLSTVLRKKIEAILEEALKGVVSNHYTQVAESHLARLQIIIKTTPGTIPAYNLQLLEDKVEREARIWTDDLLEELERRFGGKEGPETYEQYKEAFSLSYTTRFSVEDAYYDILKIRQVVETGHSMFDVYQSVQEANPDVMHIKIYSPHTQLALSKVMPILENMGIDVIDEHTYQVTPTLLEKQESIWIHRFRFLVQTATRPKLKEIKRNFEDAIVKVWDGHLQNDNLNKLIVYAHLEWRAVALLRVYIKYLQQIRFPYTQNYIQEALTAHPRTVRALVELFYVRFDPAFSANRESKTKQIVQNIEKVLGQISNLAEDRIIRAFMETILATWRTNFFQKDAEGHAKSYISFKINSRAISFMPKPRPYAEIFVHSPRVSGIHLRGGKVARGGLRWSDRREDFRTEVLGLMKAQMSKNAVIIPVGSKGGFVVKQMPKEGGREAMMQEGIECYKIFLRGLLDITDNLAGGKVVPPKEVVRYDGDDPYLVVAADKGTATFSDIANSVSAEYNFWLGDAFASGGSAGYDHKKMAITARGAWISVWRHFREMGIDTQKDTFTVVGIGDMAGDVFGNGLLRSSTMKLVAAFNHMHIFLDPDPDPAKSYAERQRLFDLPRSTWADYDPKLISKGGGVFERSAKSITLSVRMQEVLGTNREVLTPDELIQVILLAPVDLLWNGGIGTYVKSRIESNESVGDKANDLFRVNGEDLRVKVIGEGGNLGFTQLGRIEYAEKGGRINTDAIDNSAGVDCSDHEVNIKIALDNAVRSKQVSHKERNKLLGEMTEEVAALVLRDNELQTQFLSLTQALGSLLLEGHGRAIESLEREGMLDRKIEFLPEKEEIARRQSQGKGLTRPEISVLMAYSKLALQDELLKTKLPDDPYYIRDLERYFPKKLQIRLAKDIHKHPLRREIVSTVITNSLINRVGIEIYFLLKESSGMEASDIARVYTIVRDIYGLEEIWAQIESAHTLVSYMTQIELFLEMRKLIERVMFWMLRHSNHTHDITKMVDHFGGGIKTLYSSLPTVLSVRARERYEERLAYYISKHVPETLAKTIAGMHAMVAGGNIVEVSRQTKLKVPDVAKVYYTIGERLQLDWLREQLDKINTSSYWQKASIKTLTDDVFNQQKRLTSEAITYMGKVTQQNLAQWEATHEKQIKRYQYFIDDMKTSEATDFAMVLVAIGKIKEIG